MFRHTTNRPTRQSRKVKNIYIVKKHNNGYIYLPIHRSLLYVTFLVLRLRSDGIGPCSLNGASSPVLRIAEVFSYFCCFVRIYFTALTLYNTGRINICIAAWTVQRVLLYQLMQVCNNWIIEIRQFGMRLRVLLDCGSTSWTYNPENLAQNDSSYRNHPS